MPMSRRAARDGVPELGVRPPQIRTHCIGASPEKSDFAKLGAGRSFLSHGSSRRLEPQVWASSKLSKVKHGGDKLLPLALPLGPSL